MPFLDGIRLALNQIWVQKLKSGFTLLGVMIGVMFLITVVSIVEGMGRYMEDDLVGKLIGVNTFELRHRPNFQMGDVDNAEREAWRKRQRITDQDIEPVVAALPDGVNWSMQSEDQITVESKYSRPRRMQVFAVGGDYFGIKKLGVESGRIPSAQEMTIGAKVVVIGRDVIKRLFPGVSPLGRDVKIGGLPYTVIGVAESQGSAFGISFDNFVIAPYSTPVKRLLNRKRSVIDAITLQTASAAGLNEAQERVRQVMRSRHKLRPGTPDDFSLQTSESALEFWNKIKRYLVLAGIALPAIGLVVGAIVIMNIMLVAVAERTREIGIRKSLGARRRDIMTQFLIESATLSTLGAAIGVAMGITLSQLIAAVSPLPASVAPWSIVVGVMLGAGVGIVAGVYPASRASRLDPIDALRQE